MTAGKSAKNSKHLLTGLWGLLSILGLAYCLAAFLYLRAQLTPAMPEPTAAIDLIGTLTLPALALAGLYHLFLLYRALQHLAGMPAGRWLHSAYLTAIVVSGLLLGTEPVQLSEIGKEYVLFDVSGQWLFLIGSTLLHLAVVTAGYLRSRKAAGGPFDSRSDAFYATMHQVGILCGLLGILGVMSYTQWGVLERYRVFLILPLSALALWPWAAILAFLILRNRNKPLAAWFDEKQTGDMAAGALCAMLVMMPLLVILSAVDLRVSLEPPFSFWFMQLFFLCLILFSGTVLIRSGRTAGSDDAEGKP
ncbi:MAG: hypothetical protein ACK2UB_08000 [Anaerolineales bacterium]|jgi:hypothetical protein